jgi:O-antigen biosynthesis protein
LDGVFGGLARSRRLNGGDAAVRAIFDPAYYLRAYPDVAEAGADPFAHFMSVGWAEGRNPCALFDTELYLDNNPDVAQVGLNPLVHYVKAGAREGRPVSLLFDAQWYLAKSPDLEAAGINPLAHYLTAGAAEGREANPLFDEAWYRARYPEAAAATCALAHFAEHGASGAFSPHPLFDAAYYLERYPDVAEAGMNPLAHYLARGHEQPRQPHPLFDAEWYLATYPDVAQAGVNPLLHYLWEGAKEGRKPNPSFDTEGYLSKHPELADGGVNPLVHYALSPPPSWASLTNCKRRFRRHLREWDAEREGAFLDKLARTPLQIDGIKVSIIMPTRNRAACIGQAISSVIAQSHSNWELVVIDDGSEDHTAQIVASFHDQRIRFAKNAAGRGVSAARNAGLSIATGEWLFFLDTDNRWRPHMLETLLKFAVMRGTNAAYCAANLSDDNNTQSVLYADFEMESCLAQNYIDLNCFCVRRAASTERFDESLRRLVDWDYILRIASNTPILGAPFIGVEYYNGAGHQRITNSEHIADDSLDELMRHIRNRATHRLLQKTGEAGGNKIQKIAVVFHVYHRDVVADCLAYLKNIPVPFDLFVTTSHDLTDPTLVEIRREFDSAVMLQYPNVGSDVGPFMELVSTLSAYDLVCKIHTKRDADRWGSAWRDALLSSVLGSKEMVHQIIRRFEQDERVLAAGGRQLFKLGALHWIPETREHVMALANTVGFSQYLRKNWSFFAGTVFWMRPRLLTKLARHACDGTFFSNTFQRDGAIEHAWERLLGMSLLQVEDGMIIASTVAKDSTFRLDLLRPTEGSREDVWVTLDKIISERAKLAVQHTASPPRMQVSDCDHETLVSDDGSTDGARSVIQESAHPGLVKSIGGADAGAPSNGDLARIKPSKVVLSKGAVPASLSGGVRTRRIAIFAFYDNEGLIPAYTQYYLEKLAEVVDMIVFVSDCDVASAELEKISNSTSVQIVGRHEEYDFGSYKRGLRYIKDHGLLAQFDQVVLCNDSCVGPVRGFQDVFGEMEKKSVDFWGITDNDEYEYHIQSYFICLSRTVAESRTFSEFMDGVRRENSVRDVVLNYEVKLTGILRAAGFSCATLVPQRLFRETNSEPVERHLLLYPRLLLDRKSPFVKVKALKFATHNTDGVDQTLKWIATHNSDLHSAAVAHPDIGRYAAASSVKFSIIIPTHNRKETIIAAIRSALLQTHENFELIVIDDASNDGTYEAICESFGQEIGSKLVYHRAQHRVGVSRARNLGLSLAKHAWIAYLDSDNVLQPNFLSVFANNIIANSASKCFYANFRRQSDGRIVGRPFDYQALSDSNFVDLGVFVHSRELFTRMGGFDPNLRCLVDWDLILKYTRAFAPAYIPRVLLDYQDRQDESRISVRESAATANAYIMKKHFDKTIITTCILSYNHEQFIEQAICSALAQRGDGFVQEILISDDGSTDQTRSIVQSYARKHPLVVRDISPTRNIGISNNFRNCFAEASGEFIAILEGDDYWTSPDKLATQLAFMRANPDCPMVFSKVNVLNTKTNACATLERQDRLTASKLTGADFLADPHMNLIANFSSCVFRAECMKEAPDRLFHGRFNEIATAFYLDTIGPIGFVDRVMSVYRQHPDGVWTGANRQAQLEGGLMAREVARDLARPKYKAAIQEVINSRFVAAPASLRTQ